MDTMTAAPAAATRTSIAYDTAPCGRCSGTGQMPFSNWGGKCFDCSGAGFRLTPAARKIRELVAAVLETRLAVRMDELTEGLVTYDAATGRQGRATFVEVGERTSSYSRTSGGVTDVVELREYRFAKVTKMAQPSALRYRGATSEDIEAAVAALGRRTAGFTVTRA